MKKKILTIITVMVIMVATLTNAYATDGFFDFGVFETAYKLSNEADIELPFINIFSKGATYDKIVKHSGISIGDSTIDIDEKLEGVHFIMSQDMITIKGEVEHGIIYGTNIVVEGKISGDTILMAETVQILEGAVIEKDLIIVADDFTMDGTINGNLIGAVSHATINGTIEKDMRLDIASISLENSTIAEEIYLSVPEGVDVKNITDKYPNATINTIAETTETSIQGEEIATIFFNGAKVVLIYVVVACIITKKENNIATKATTRFTENSSFGILTGAAMLMLVIVVPILLIILALCGLGTIAWPVFILYVALVLFSISVSSFVVGITLYEVLKKKLGKYKIPVLALIFAVIYALTKIPYISTYALLAINLVSMAIIMSYIFKREEKVEETIVDNRIEDVKEDKKEDK